MFKLKLLLHGTEVKEIELLHGRVYTFGRGANCDIQLEEQPGISRVHFRLTDELGNWNVEVISKFGDVLYLGQRVSVISLDHGSVFKLAGYDFRFEEVNEEEMRPSQNLPATQSFPSAAGDGFSSHARLSVQQSQEPDQSPSSRQKSLAPAPEFNGNDEATRIMPSEPEVPYLRMVEPGGIEELIKLDGRRWVAGREEASSILLNDRKSSRRQFELTSTPQGFFVRDLGSSNGTLLNGMPLAPDELKPIRSGDVIQVGQVTLHFEVRDPQFEKRLLVVPENVRSEAPIVLHNGYEMINYPILTGPGGAVRIDGSREGQNKLVAYVMGEDLQNEKDKKKRRLIVAISAIACFLALYTFVIDDTPPVKKQAQHDSAFSKLSPNNQQIVRETFVLAKNLYMQKKLALAAGQLLKIHQLLPEGYNNSLAMAEDCRDAALQDENLRFIEEQRKKQEETNRIINETLNKCERLSRTTLDPEALKICMSPALLNAPDDPRVRELLQRVDRRIAERQQEAANRRARARSAAKGKELFKEAEALENNGQDLDAIETYKQFIASNYSDPEGLKQTARKNLLGLTQRLTSKVDEALHAAETAYTSQAFKDALLQIKKAKALSPDNEKAAEMNARYRRELNMKLKDIYEEAVISEGIGDVEQAKVKWKKILEMDLPEGEYYKKAKSKLRSYGAL